MEFVWINPINNQKFNVNFRGDFPGPTEYLLSKELSAFWDAIFRSVRDLANNGDTHARQAFGLILLYQRNTVPEALSRMPSAKLVQKILDSSTKDQNKRLTLKENIMQWQLTDKFGNPERNISSLQENISKELCLCLSGKDDLTHLKGITANEVAFLDDVIRVQHEVFGSEKLSSKKVDNFRERVERSLSRHGLSKEDYRNLLLKSTIAVGRLCSLLGESFLESDSIEQLPELDRSLFWLLQTSASVFSILGIAIAAHPSFPPLCQLYKIAFSTDIIVDLRKCIRLDSTIDEEELGKFLQQFLATAKWYRSIYIYEARTDDKRGLTIGHHPFDETSDISSVSLSPLQMLIESENTVPSDFITSQNSSLTVLGNDRQSIHPATDKLTRKQREVLDRLMQGQSIQEVADELGLTRQAIDRRFQNIKKRLAKTE